jgi:hypothetical protein
MTSFSDFEKCVGVEVREHLKARSWFSVPYVKFSAFRIHKDFPGKKRR